MNSPHSRFGPLGIVVLAAAGVALITAIDGTLYAKNREGLGVLVCAGALFGAFLGTIYATDPRSGLQVVPRPLVRTVVSMAMGFSVGMVLGLSARAIAITGAVFGVLGWFGMSWARYVDF